MDDPADYCARRLAEDSNLGIREAIRRIEGTGVEGSMAYWRQNPQHYSVPSEVAVFMPLPLWEKVLDTIRPE